MTHITRNFQNLREAISKRLKKRNNYKYLASQLLYFSGVFYLKIGNQERLCDLNVGHARSRFHLTAAVPVNERPELLFSENLTYVEYQDIDDDDFANFVKENIDYLSALSVEVESRPVSLRNDELTNSEFDFELNKPVLFSDNIEFVLEKENDQDKMILNDNENNFTQCNENEILEIDNTGFTQKRAISDMDESKFIHEISRMKTLSDIREMMENGEILFEDLVNHDEQRLQKFFENTLKYESLTSEVVVKTIKRVIKKYF